MEKFIDLANRDNCVTAVITIADKEFRITRVVNAVRVAFSNHIVKMGQMLKMLSSKIDNEGKLKKFEQRVDEFAKNKEETYDKLLTWLLEANGYKYDKQWWMEHTTEDEIRLFIESCLNKDVKDEDVKKKTIVS